MFYELGQSYSDTLKLHRIARDIGDLHQALKDETGRFYLSVKTLCNTDQQKSCNVILLRCSRPLVVRDRTNADRKIVCTNISTIFVNLNINL